MGNVFMLRTRIEIDSPGFFSHQKDGNMETIGGFRKEAPYGQKTEDG